MRQWSVVVVLGLAASLSAAPAERMFAQVSDADGMAGERIGVGEMTATASTTLCEKNKACHGPELLFDGKNATAWCEGLPDDGVGATLTFVFKKPERLSGIYVVPLYAKSFALAEQNGRPATVDLTTDSGTFTAELDDIVPVVRKRNPVKEDNDDCGDETCLSRDQRIGSYGQSITFGRYSKGDRGDFTATPVTTTKLVITLREVYKGKRFRDTCMSRLDIIRAK